MTPELTAAAAAWPGRRAGHGVEHCPADAAAGPRCWTCPAGRSTWPGAAACSATTSGRRRCGRARHDLAGRGPGRLGGGPQDRAGHGGRLTAGRVRPVGRRAPGRPSPADDRLIELAERVVERGRRGGACRSSRPPGRCPDRTVGPARRPRLRPPAARTPRRRNAHRHPGLRPDARSRRSSRDRTGSRRRSPSAGRPLSRRGCALLRRFAYAEAMADRICGAAYAVLAPGRAGRTRTGSMPPRPRCRVTG